MASSKHVHVDVDSNPNFYDFASGGLCMAATKLGQQFLLRPESIRRGKQNKRLPNLYSIEFSLQGGKILFTFRQGLMDGKQQPMTCVLQQISITGQLHLDKCQHFAQIPTVFPVVDEVSKRLFLLQSTSKRNSVKKDRWKMDREIRIAVFKLQLDTEGKGWHHAMVNSFTGMFTHTPSLLPVGLVIRPVDGALFIVFHCCARETNPKQGITLAKVAFQSKNPSSIRSLIGFSLPPQLHALQSIGQSTSSYFLSESGEKLYWPYVHGEAENRMRRRILLIACCLTTDAIDSCRNMVAFLVIPPSVVIKCIYGKIGRFLFFFTNSIDCEHPALWAYSLQSRMTHLVAVQPNFMKSVLHDGRKQFLKTAAKQLLGQERQENSYRCEHCYRVVKQKPKLCRICKRIGAAKFLNTTGCGVKAGGLSTTFCSRSCLKMNWQQHKQLHILLKQQGCIEGLVGFNREKYLKNLLE